LIVASLAANAIVSVYAQPFDKCAKDEYYAGTSLQSRSDIIDLLTKTHRKVLPNTSPIKGGDDTLSALVDLYPGDVAKETVHLIYRDISFPAYPAYTLSTWMREDLWPIERGAARDTPAMTDVFGKAPADRSVQEIKRSLFFGECGTVENSESCMSPATTETASTTQQDAKTFAPPKEVRGDVARAIFYNALRYEKELGFKLSDCPPFDDHEFGYLSQLLQWHIDDPVDEKELARNDRACERWQGNRNVFIDYPELVKSFFGEPDTILPGTYTYAKCTAITEAPTATHNECQQFLEPGDIAVFSVNSDNEDSIVFYPLSDIPGSVETLYMTNMPWTGEKFLKGPGEGTVEFDIPAEGIKAGTSFGYGEGIKFTQNWNVEAESEDFDISDDGDQLFVYCMNADGYPHFITGFNFAGEDWVARGMPELEYGTNRSALPERLEETSTSVSLPHKDNWIYIGPRDGFKTDLLKQFSNSSNYQGFDDVRINIVSAAGASGLTMIMAASTILLTIVTASLW